MTINLRYPIRNCYFCDNIMLYTRYEMGGNYTYCNNDKSCMGMIYTINDNDITIKEFTIGDFELLYFKVSPKDNMLLLHQENGPRALENILNVDINTILYKDKSIKLLEKIRKAVLLLD